MSFWSISSGMSTGSTIRFRDGTAKAPIPSGMNSTITLFCSNSEWVAKRDDGNGVLDLEVEPPRELVVRALGERRDLGERG